MVERIDICVCTFRRPALEQTLESIAALALPEDLVVRVIVADNDDTSERHATIAAIGARLKLDLTYVHAPAHNISIARNACLDSASSRWIAFIDDDEVAAHDWLVTLLAARAGADVIFGVSQAQYSDPAIPDWLRRGDFHSNRIAGNDAPWNGYTANVLINREVLLRHGLRFDTAFGRTGGEDTKIFLELCRKGAIFGYAPDAVVFEETSSARATLGWLLRRRYRAGQVHYRLHGGAGAATLAIAITAAAKAGACAVLAAITLPSRSRRTGHLLRGALHLGVFGSAIGLATYREYG